MLVNVNASRIVARIRSQLLSESWSEYPHAPHSPTLPGPWGFLTSGYIVGLIVMAVLMHRIQNIVVPPRHRPNPRPRHSLFLHSLSRAVFPLDLSSSLVRLVLRLPSLFFLSKSLLLWSAALAQTARCHFLDVLLSTSLTQLDTAALCWFSFCSVCGALCVDALTRGLEGTTSNASPFNLFGYAFLLHIYSSPMTHATKLQGLPSRPDKHVVFTILLPLLQLTIVHTLGIKQSWSNHRLIPSAFVSIIALIHFHYVLWFSDSTYPLLNYMPCLFESVLIFVTFLAIFLNAFTQIVTEGALSSPLFGHRAALLPRLDEDFSIALLRMGTASLETSSVAGLGNEVGGIALMSSLLDHTDVATVQLNRLGVSSLSSDLQPHRNHRRSKKGFSNEIKNVKATANDGDLWLDLAWYREFVKFTIGIARFLKRMYIFLRAFLRSPRTRLSPDIGDTDCPDEFLQDVRQDPQDLYDSFVRGEQLSDDEHDEYEPSSRSRSNSVESLSSISDSPETTLYDSQAEAVGLYADLSSVVATATSTSHLLAHLVDHSSSPLTRRRFNELISGTSSSLQHRETRDGWTDVIHARRPLAVVSRPEAAIDETRRNCVICTAEPRQIICWPCRCLALCDDCRANLATRSSVSKHTCPCCRTNVDGYSKIFIP